MSTILVVDDDPQLLRALRINLRAYGYEVLTARTGASALQQVASANPDLVVLDLGLPDIDGVEVLQGIRGWSQVPVVILTARTDSAQTVAALDCGADDYVTKPFGMNEFLARIRAALRRGAAAPKEVAGTVVNSGDVSIDLATKTVTKAGKPVHVTPTEWGILELLAKNKGKLISQRMMLQDVWGPSYGSETHYLRVYMAQLRRKLEDDVSHPVILITEPGMGYRLA